VDKQLFEPWTAILGNRRTNVDNNNIAGYFFLILEFYICVNIKLIDVEIFFFFSDGIHMTSIKT
jgi:hypothetical protein